ncbi:MAG TPA: flagellar biosynthesis protein FlhB [Steroidobacteraceae bacterium]|jgi:flagellar biosynthetic protein FlhB|nr:flagellar biosynthesis protein FlhB [Steroidobacteraceae bacterium]
MAENENGQDRTEQPTQKRLDEARKSGQVPRSRELTTAAVVLIAGIGLRFSGAGMSAGFATLMKSGLTLTREQALDENLMLPNLVALAWQGLVVAGPILGLTLAAALLSPLAIGGWNMSFTALVPNFSRLNPIEGLQRLFSVRGVIELAKAYAKFLLVGLIAIIFLRAKTAELLSLGSEPLNVAMAHAVNVTGSALLALSASLAIIAGIDVPLTLRQYTNQLRMSRQEVRQEHRESDGSPEVKGRIRRMQQDLARRRMLQEVPKADVVITNPTHYSVALRYDEKRMRAPVVVAKGVDEVAANIRKIAVENKVPVFEAPPLARVLFRDVDLNAEVPASLYVAVAQVLTYVLQLRNPIIHGAARPVPPVIDPLIEQTRH